MLSKEPFSYEYIASIIEYRDGKLYSLVNRGPLHIGDQIGHLNSRGYIDLKIQYKIVSVHRLVWLLCHRRWPSIVDHINGIKDDNRIENLRECTAQENARNRSSQKGKGRLLGTNRHLSGKWQVYCARRYIGLYKTEEEAARAYDAAALKAYGEFARLNYPQEVA